MNKGLSESLTTNHPLQLSERKKTIFLIIFAVIAWGLLWKEVWHYLSKVLNYSWESLVVTFQSMVHQNKEEAIRLFRKDFYYPHVLFLIMNFLLAPLITGFYIGRHSKTKKYRNGLIVLILVIFYHSFSDYIFADHDITAFIIRFLLLGYLSFTPLFFLVSLGALIGGSVQYTGSNPLHLSIVRNLISKRRKGLFYLFLAVALLFIQFRSIDKGIEDLILPYLKYCYAPVTFNNYKASYPILQVINSPEEVSVHSDEWSNLADLKNGNMLQLRFYYNNGNSLYRSINTKLFLREKGVGQFVAKISADNMQPVEQTITLSGNCKKPTYIFEGSKWYSFQSGLKETRPFLNNQTGHEILNPSGLDIGEVLGRPLGYGFVLVKLTCQCDN